MFNADSETIEAMEAEIERLRAALAVVEREVGEWECDGPNGPCTVADLIRYELSK